MTDFVGVNIAGARELADRINNVPPEAADDGVEAANEYIVNVEQAYAPYAYVSIQQSGGWASERQRRYVMARIREGTISIPYRRTQNLRRGWERIGDGRNQIVVNQVPYAGYVKDIQSQSRGHMLRGWNVIQNDLRERMEEIVRKFDAGVDKALKRLALK